MTRVVLAKPRLLKWTTTAVTVVQFSSLCGPGSGRYVRVNIIRDQHKCMLKHHDDPDAVMLTQLPGNRLAAVLEGIRFCSPRQKVDK